MPFCELSVVIWGWLPLREPSWFGVLFYGCLLEIYGGISEHEHEKYKILVHLACPSIKYYYITITLMFSKVTEFAFNVLHCPLCFLAPAPSPALSSVPPP